MSSFAQVRAAFDQLITSSGYNCEFKLRSGEQFTIKGAGRHLVEESLTQGLQQDRMILRILAQHWQVAAPPGRNPEKGDQVTIVGRRHAVQEAYPALYENQQLGWILRLTG